MNFVKNAAEKTTKAFNDFVDSSDEDEDKRKKSNETQTKKNAGAAAAATKEDDDSNDDNNSSAAIPGDDKNSSSSFSSVDTEDLEEAGEIVADVYTGGMYGAVVEGIEAAEAAEDIHNESRKNKAMKWIKGRKVFLVRHGNTNGAPKDEERRLTPEGESQCAAFRSSFASELGGVTFVFCSPATRTVETARLLGFPDAVAVPDLYFGPHLNDDIRELDSELGYAPLADYLRGRGSDIYSPVRMRMAYALGKAGTSELERKEEGEKGGDVLIVGHATYLSLLALEVLGAMKRPDTEDEPTAFEKAKSFPKKAWKATKEVPGAALEEVGKKFREESDEPDEVKAACEGEEKILSFNVGEVEGFEISAKGEVRLLKS